jgi:hypothetical protein
MRCTFKDVQGNCWVVCFCKNEIYTSADRSITVRNWVKQQWVCFAINSLEAAHVFRVKSCVNNLKCVILCVHGTLAVSFHCCYNPANTLGNLYS